VAAHLFEPFFTTKGNKGTGLGLTLSREYLERAGGTIEAGQGRLGGALFSVELPGGEAPAPPSGAR
jgi:C4-dicarboxylate-specific signal transduction histidine kinase